MSYSYPDEHRRSLVAPVAITLVFIAGGLFARGPIVDALTHRIPPGASLDTSFAYRVIAPVSNLFDALTLLSLPQVFSTFAFVCALAVIARSVLVMRRAREKLPPLRIRDHLRFGANVVGIIVAVSGLALLAPRPMAALHLSNPDLLAVDFHSHTSASHDGRPSFTPEKNREWHRRAGFDAAYITDHHTFAGARAAEKSNPPRAGSGVVMLTGLEYRDEDEHLLALGLDSHTINPERREWHPIMSANAASVEGVPALLILSLPGDVKTIPPDENIGSVRLAAIELSDGSPRGMGQAADDFSAIRSLAQRSNLALVAGSDNHGWGNTAAAWSVMSIPHWRTMSPGQLDAGIRRTLLTRGRFASQVVSRRLPPSASALAVAMTGPEIAIQVVRDISWTERISWIFWTWTLAFALLLGRRESWTATDKELVASRQSFSL